MYFRVPDINYNMAGQYVHNEIQHHYKVKWKEWEEKEQVKIRMEGMVRWVSGQKVIAVQACHPKFSLLTPNKGG